MLLDHAACVMYMLPFSFYFWDCQPMFFLEFLAPDWRPVCRFTKCLQPLLLRCQRRRRLPLLRIGLRGRIVGVVLYWWEIVLLVSLIPLILARPSGPFRVVFPKWSLLVLWSLDKKARCAEPTAFLLHKGNSGSFLRLFSVAPKPYFPALAWTITLRFESIRKILDDWKEIGKYVHNNWNVASWKVDKGGKFTILQKKSGILARVSGQKPAKSRLACFVQ